jgi:protein-tyrosine phosphatase
LRKVTGHSLWLGHVGDVHDPSELLAAGISAVVDLALNEQPAKLPRKLVYCRFPLIDGPGNRRALLRTAVETVANLLRSGTPTLVYCGAGMSRSPAVAGAAIALVSGYSLAEGLVVALQSGPGDVSPGLWAAIEEAMR